MKTVQLEFHCHTIYSRDSLTRPEALVAACRRKGIDRIVVTDHDTIRGALIAQELAPELVIVGEEIRTRQGEILAAFVSAEIPSGLHALEVIDRLREQEAFISVSHPFDRSRSGHWSLPDLRMIAPWVDAIEVFNARCISARFNERAAQFAAEQGLPGTAGSDAHGLVELGRARIELPDFRDASELRESLKGAVHLTRRSGPWVRLISRYAVLVKAVLAFDPPRRSG